MKNLSLLIALVAGTASAAVPLKNGTRFWMKDVPEELVVERRAGEPVRFALERERDSGIRSTAMENHGREWEIYDDAKLVAFAKRSRAVNPKMPVGIQVNDRDWFEKLDRKLDRVESKLDKLLEIANRPLPDGMQRAE